MKGASEKSEMWAICSGLSGRRTFGNWQRVSRRDEMGTPVVTLRGERYAGRMTADD
jgi:hypothetical protein